MSNNILRVTECVETGNIVIRFNERDITQKLDTYRYNVVKVLERDVKHIKTMILENLGNNEYLLNL